jgi:hypothetical protein
MFAVNHSVMKLAKWNDIITVEEVVFVARLERRVNVMNVVRRRDLSL